MALDVNKSITIDLVNKSYKVIDLVQNDSARSITFSLLLNGNKFNLTGLAVRAFSSTDYYKDLTIINATEGVCKLLIDNKMINKSGNIELQLRISDGSVMVTSFIVILKATKSLIDKSSIQSDNRIGALDTALNEVQVLKVELQGASSDLEKKYTTRLTITENKISILEKEVYGCTNLLRSTGLKKNSDNINNWLISKADASKTEIYLDENNLTPHLNRSWHISNTDTSGYYGLRQDLSLKLLADTTYTLSYWIMPTKDNSGQCLLTVQYKDSNKNNVFHTHYYKNSELTLNKWTKMTYTFTTKSNINKSWIILGISTQKCEWYGVLGDIKLELGAHASDWSPSPEDLVYQASKYTDEQYQNAKNYTDEVTKKAYINGKISSNFNLEAGTSYTFESLSTYINKNITNTLQCSLAGMYNVSAHISLYNRASSNEECQLEVKILVNDTEASSTMHYVVFGPLTYTNVLVNTIVYVTAGDSIKIKVTNREDSRGYTLDYTQSYINIYKI